MIINFHRLVTRYGNVKSEIKPKFVFIVVGLHMLIDLLTDPTRKSILDFYKRVEEVTPIKKSFEICLVRSLNSQINIT